MVRMGSTRSIFVDYEERRYPRMKRALLNSLKPGHRARTRLSELFIFIHQIKPKVCPKSIDAVSLLAFMIAPSLNLNCNDKKNFFQKKFNFFASDATHTPLDFSWPPRIHSAKKNPLLYHTGPQPVTTLYAAVSNQIDIAHEGLDGSVRQVLWIEDVPFFAGVEE